MVTAMTEFGPIHQLPFKFIAIGVLFLAFAVGQGFRPAALVGVSSIGVLEATVALSVESSYLSGIEAAATKDKDAEGRSAVLCLALEDLPIGEVEHGLS